MGLDVTDQPAADTAPADETAVVDGTADVDPVNPADADATRGTAGATADRV